MTRQKIEIGSKAADPKYKITITQNGPYLVYGQPPLAQQFIVANRLGESWRWMTGESFDTKDEPTALCRCGSSKRKPYCDGSHTHTKWNSKCTASTEGILDDIESTSAEDISISDSRKYCAFARFCDASIGISSLMEDDSDPTIQRLAIRQATLCPSGRFLAWDNLTDTPFELRYKPSLALIEDYTIAASGGLWVKGGIRIEHSNGTKYEIRNRVVLCRCGKSSNKPYCDGSHAAAGWQDNLAPCPEYEQDPECLH